MDNFLRASLRRVGTCLVLLSGALMGCTSAWGRSIEVPDELREHASVYDATAEHQSFDAQASRQRVTFELKEGREIEVSLMAPSGEATDYLIIAQSYRRQYVIKSQGRTLLYAEVDWSHWGFGERGFQVVVANGLTCDQHENVIDLFLFAKVLSGA